MKKKEYCILLSKRDYFNFRQLAMVNNYIDFEASSYDSENTYVTLELDKIDYIIISDILDLI